VPGVGHTVPVTNAGWYPDPAGAPDTYRYWDGLSWSQMTTSAAPAQPTSPPPAPAPAPAPVPTVAPPTGPPPPPPYAPQQQWSPMPPAGPGAPGGGGRGKVVGIAVAAVLVLALIGAGGFFGIRALTGDDDSASDATDSSASSDATDSSDEPSDRSEAGEPGDGGTSAMRPTAIQCGGGSPAPLAPPDASAREITGGGLTMPVLSDYAVSPESAAVHVFADGVQVQYTEVIARKWISEYALGGVPVANGFTSPEHAADVLMQCIAADPNFYKGFSGRKDLTSEDVTVDGRPGYRITAELRVSDPAVTMGGDDVTVIVVDTGSADTYGLFLGVVPIGDGARGDQLEAAIESLDVR
jgi:hypothetical protein